MRGRCSRGRRDLPGTGLKKCNPANLLCRSSEQVSEISVTGREDVFVAKIQAGL